MYDTKPTDPGVMTMQIVSMKIVLIEETMDVNEVERVNHPELMIGVIVMPAVCKGIKIGIEIGIEVLLIKTKLEDQFGDPKNDETLVAAITIGEGKRVPDHLWTGEDAGK